MIRAAGLGVAVGNAYPALKDAADLVTTGQYGAGVVEALKDQGCTHGNSGCTLLYKGALDCVT
jgi:3-deoxy-D-manno-octulosonate 8-phosphate phosphatase KdsC-like HAD superfamily phosphatase